MNLKHLQSFLTLAEQGSLVRAAAASNMAESLLSRHIASLETAWGAAMDQFLRLGVIAQESAGLPTGAVSGWGQVKPDRDKKKIRYQSIF